MLLEPETWVALAFVLFLAGLGYIGVHRMLAKALDERSARIKAELDEARKLKDEAAQLLADYQRKRSEAESEAQEIIAGAKAEAERLAIEAKTKIEEFVARRTKMAEAKSPKPRRRPPPTCAAPRRKPPSPPPPRCSAKKPQASSPAI